MTSFAVSSGKRVPFHAFTCFFIGSKFRCMRSTPTERMSTRLRCLVCLASTGVNAPGTMLPSAVQGRGWVNYSNDRRGSSRKPETAPLQRGQRPRGKEPGMRRECDAVSGDVHPGTAEDGRGGKDWSSYRPLLETCTDQTARQARTAVMPLLNTGVAAQWAAELPVTRCPKVGTALQRALALGLVQPQVPACSFSCFTTAAT